MKKVISHAVLICLLLSSNLSLMAQDTLDDNRLSQIQLQLDVLKLDNPGLDEIVELSISDIPLDEFLRMLAMNHQLNLDISPGLNNTITNNFSNITVAEVLYFLAKSESLDFQFTGNIIEINLYKEPVVEEVYAPEKLHIVHDTLTGKYTVDFKHDSLSLVAKQLTQTTGKNIVFSPPLAGKKISLYMQDATLITILEQLSFANGIELDSQGDTLFHLSEKVVQAKGNSKKASGKKTKNTAIEFEIKDGLISLVATGKPISEIIKAVFDELKLDYYYYNDLQSDISLKVYEEPMELFLKKLFNGTKYTYRNIDGVYYFGDRTLEGLRETRRIHLKNRSVEDIKTYIPKNLVKDIELLEFPELNSLIVSGSYPQIEEIQMYLNSIDHPVPVVQIEVIIIDYNRNNDMATGIEMGLGTSPAQTTGSLGSSGFNATMGAQTINSMITSFNGFGSLNLGPVTPNFYVTLQAMETKGVIKTRSTPKLATLNGTEANINIGQTEYYVVENQSLQGVQNPVPLVTRSYNSVQAEFSLKIKPFLAGDDQITLAIEVQQSDFTARIAPDAPPGQVSRTFNTIIRVRNEEMILLGGLEETKKENTTSGVPFLAKIPIIKWFFSKQRRQKADNRLNIFIKPTIIQ